MLKPTDLTQSQYAVALKPALGYELQLYVSQQPATNLGTIEVVAPNSGTYTPNVSDNLVLAGVPQELLVALNRDVDLGGQALTVTVNGTDSTNAPCTGIAVFQPPAYAQDQSFAFPARWAHEVTTTGQAGKKWKAVLSVSIAYAGAATPEILLLGMPSADFTSQGTFVKIGTKVNIDYDPKVPMPTAVQDGRDKGKYIKTGEIEIGKLEITAKSPDAADGLQRINGRRVTGWLREAKEDQVNTQNIFVGGLIVTVTASAGESVEPFSLKGTGMFETISCVLAH